jgi:hypothetical protein
VGKEQAGRALCNLSFDQLNKTIIKEAGGVAALEAYAKIGTAAGKEAAQKALRNARKARRATYPRRGAAMSQKPVLPGILVQPPVPEWITSGRVQAVGCTALLGSQKGARRIRDRVRAAGRPALFGARATGCGRRGAQSCSAEQRPGAAEQHHLVNSDPKNVTFCATKDQLVSGSNTPILSMGCNLEHNLQSRKWSSRSGGVDGSRRS